MEFPYWKINFSDLCDDIVINSTGIEKQLMGKYHYYQSSNGRPMFKHSSFYYLHFASDDQWKVCYTNNCIYVKKLLLDLISSFLIVLITFLFTLQISKALFLSLLQSSPFHVFHPSCKEVFPTKCALNEWKVRTSNDDVFKTNRNFSISCGKLLSFYYIEY